ncbi:hypothetical protein [Gordonibacter massiliensis (ex Traore et al. 2017)]|uniref:hypothetical protein n=1 Tax=Gordonibacter massiliensis (ex Traore et al. 2017) TaxID=1841863 RepID=UPI001C8C5E8F|nr:hypothetical protein [Gordonibacter massiliensis (ex Traore et al. 2017)]MBX9035189.1 hypothetical protein [Gordonibacter massiliensis (ex Traore et al. 2017)]
MSDIEEIIANTEATMAIENLQLTQDDLVLLRDCLEERSDFNEEVAQLVAKHQAA